MKVKTNLLMFGLLTVFGILLTAIASAELSISVTSVPSTASHDQGNVQVLFTLTNTGNTAETGLVWTSSSNIGTWSSVPTVTQIGAGAQLSLSAVLTVPKYSSGTISANINVRSASNEAETLTVNLPITNSATLTLSKVRDITRTQKGKIKVENTGNVNLNNIELSSSGDFSATFSQNNFGLAPGRFNDNIEVDAGDLTNLKFGANPITIIARDSAQNTQGSVSLAIASSFCKNGDVGGNLSIESVDIQSNGDEDDEWKPLDVIEVEAKVENVGDDDVRDVNVKLGLFDSKGKNRIGDLDFENADEEEIQVGKLNDGDKETVNFRFRVPADLDEGDYKLAIKAFGDDVGENNECTDISDDLSDDFFQDIKIIREDDNGKFIAFENIETAPTGDVTCGDTVTIKVDVFNIGDEDQDQVKIDLRNSELKIDLNREIKNNLDQGDSDEVTFTLIIPSNAQDKSYRLDLSADYDYNRGTYRESLDESTPINIKVVGCTLPKPGEGEKKIAITASLESGAKAGEEMMVKATIANLAQEADFVVTASGFETWGTLNSISDRLIHLKSGESKDVLLNFNVNEDITGEQSFTLEVRSGSDLETRDVEFSLEEAPSGFKLDFGDNSLIWIIGIINVILIILIIVVAARISRK